MAISTALPCEHPFGQEWTVDSELGKGSYGAVYRLSRNDAGTEMVSAMKWIPLPGDREEVRRLYGDGHTREEIKAYYERLKTEFSREIQSLYQLRDNSHVVRLEDFKIIPREGEDDVGYDLYIRMELLTPLEKWISRRDKMTYRDVVRMGIDLCDALNDCRRLSIIHRDIKPDNIFVSEDNRFKLGDFGIARRLERNDINVSRRVGSLGYMSPEVFHAKKYDLRADIYSLSLVLYKYINGRRGPFTPPAQEKMTPLDMSQANETRLGGTALPRPEGLPDGLEPLWGIVRKACEFEAADRYQTPLEMKNALEAIECLPDLDEAPELSGSRSGRKQGTGRGTASSSANSLNGTFRRTPYSRGVEDESIAAARDEKKGDPAAKTEETPPDTGSRHGARKKWIAAAAALLLVAGGILAAVLLKPGRGTENSWNVLAGEATATSVTLTWTGEPEGQGILCRCFSNGIQIRPDLEAVSPLTITGLAPGTEYVFRLTAGEESAEVSADTKGEAVSGNIPIFERADFYSIRVKDLEETPAEEAADELFKEVPNGVLQMRTGPVSAQIEIQTLWLLFSTVSEDYSGELVLSLTTPEGAVFSRSVKLELPVSSGYVSKRVSLEELFGDVYAGCGGWPGEKCSLRLYLDGMSVCEKTISFTSGN